jgi:hypothetical protein
MDSHEMRTLIGNNINDSITTAGMLDKYGNLSEYADALFTFASYHIYFNLIFGRDYSIEYEKSEP